MSDSYAQGFMTYGQFSPEVRNDIYVVASNWYVNRNPLVTRSPREPVGSTKFQIINRTPRPRQVTLAAQVLTTDTTVTLVDASTIMSGDVIDLTNGEFIQVNADPNVTANTISVTRAYNGYTPVATVANSTVLNLVGNARTGSEVNQTAISQSPVPIWQTCQTYQIPVQVGGSLQATTAFQLQPAARTPFDQYKMDALQNLMDDMEYSSFYGQYADPATFARPAQSGLRQQLAANLVTSPVNAGAYGPSDFVRDVLQVPRSKGGQPDVVLVASNYMSGFSTWSNPLVRIPAGQNIFGAAIDVFTAPFLNGVNIIEAPLLKPFTAVGITSAHIRMRMKRNEFWNPRGNRGDAIEGEWIAEGAVEAENPLFHSFVEGVTAFATPY